MVNKIVFDYLAKYHGKYNLNDLKKKILGAGYSQQDIDEAIRLLGLSDNSSNIQPIFSVASNSEPVFSGAGNQVVSNSVQRDYNGFKPTEKKFKWMKLAGIIGVFYLLIGILFSIFSFLGYFSIIGSWGLYFLIGVFILIFISIFFFLYGFVKMGKYADSGILRVSAKSFIVLIILGIFLVIGMGILATFVFGDISIEISSLGLTFSEFVDNASSLGAGGENLIFDSFFSDLFNEYSLFFIGFLGLISILILLGIIFVFCFFIGLIKAGREVKFAKVSGIFGFLVLIYLLLLLLVLIGIGLFVSNINFSAFSIVLILILGIFVLFNFIGYLFSILALFSASRKFE